MLTMISFAIVLTVSALSLCLLYSFGARRFSKTQSTPDQHDLSKLEIQDAYRDIVPLADLDWRVEEPLNLRPFKPKYHLTMALETISLSELIAMDKTYLTRIKLRRDLHQRQGRLVFNCNPAAIPAVNELYTWMTNIYLPTRFPTMFKLSHSTAGKDSILQNLVTGEDIPTTSDHDPLTTLQNLSSHVDTDFLFLLPTSSTSTPPRYPGPSFAPSAYGTPNNGPSPAVDDLSSKYHLHAYAGCFPSGFNWLDKFSLPLAAIHNPAVPHYPEKLERSMDRFFATLPPAKVVSRKNWTVTTDRELFKVKGTHGYVSVGSGASEEEDEKKERERRELDLSQMVLRCERQTLHRLPESGALVFAFKTYQYELDDIKSEGSGPELADAIDGLAKGSAPRARVYKRADVWGDLVARYMRR